MSIKKEILRENILKKIFSFPKNKKKKLEKILCARIKEWEIFLKNKYIAFYYPQEFEISLKSLWNKNKYISLPKYNSQLNSYDFSYWEPQQKLKKSLFGIFEPKYFRKSKVEVVFIPGIAFDKYKNRLGKGKGFYDKILKKYSVIKVGICFEFQIVEFIPKDLWDKKMDFIVTENRIIG